MKPQIHHKKITILTKLNVLFNELWAECLSGCFGQDQMSCNDVIKMPYQKEKGELSCRDSWLIWKNRELLTSHDM